MYKTLQKFIDNKDTDLLYHIYLPLLHRTTGKLVWTVKEDSKLKVMGIEQTSRFGGDVKLTIITLNLNPSF